MRGAQCAIWNMWRVPPCVCVDGCGVFILVYSVQLYSRALPIPSVLFWSGNSVSTSPSSYLLLLTPSYIIAPHCQLSSHRWPLASPYFSFYHAHVPLHCRMSHYCTRYEHLTQNPFLLVYKVNLAVGLNQFKLKLRRSSFYLGLPFTHQHCSQPCHKVILSHFA